MRIGKDGVRVSAMEIGKDDVRLSAVRIRNDGVRLSAVVIGKDGVGHCYFQSTLLQSYSKHPFLSA